MTTQERIAKFPVLVLQKVQLEKEYENIQKERDDFMKEWDVKFQKNRLHYNLICKELDDMTVDYYIERGKQGLNKTVYSKEVPSSVNAVYNKIYDLTRNGCTGDWYDGCRGCSNNCAAEAKQEWKKMFGIETILYGERKESK